MVKLINKPSQPVAYQRSTDTAYCSASRNTKSNVMEMSAKDPGVLKWGVGLDSTNGDSQIDELQSMSKAISLQLTNILSGLRNNCADRTGRISQFSPSSLEFEKMKSSVLRIQCLVRKLNLFCGMYTSENRPVQLYDVVKEFIGRFTKDLPKHIAVEIHAPNQLPLISSDPILIEKLLRHLCKNAVEAMQSCGHSIRINLTAGINDKVQQTLSQSRKPSSFVRLTVEDTGTGISECNLDRIFHPFYSTKEEKTGRGLGLSEVYGIVKCLGASIEVKSIVGAGTAFDVFFPAFKNSRGSCMYTNE